MLNIRNVYVADSKISGKGLFADSFIPKGTIIWTLDAADKIITPEEFETLNPVSKKYVKNFCYVDESHNYVLCSDDAKYMNHSSTPNTYSGDDSTTIANCDIHEGDEITCDYFEFDHDVDFKLQ